MYPLKPAQYCASLTIGFALLLSLWLVPVLAGIPSNTPSPSAWVTGGSVNAIVIDGATTYIGGSFSYVGPNTGHGAQMDTKTGALFPALSKVTMTINVVVADGAGGWFIGGSALAHVNADGSQDGNWPTIAISNGSLHQINALTVDGGKVYVGGLFTSIGGMSRNNIAAVDKATGKVTDWNPNVGGEGWYDGQVNALAVNGSTVFVGGEFTSIGGQARHCLAAVDAATGLALPWDPNPRRDPNPLIDIGTAVTSLAFSGMTVYVGGTFTTIGGASRTNLAAIDASSGLATAWKAGADSSVSTLTVSANRVYATGYFSTGQSQQYQYIAAFDVSTGALINWNPKPDSHNIYALSVVGTTVYVVGSFANIGGRPRNHLAALDANTGLATDWNPINEDNGQIYAIAASDTKVYVGGYFSHFGQQQRNNLAAVDTATGIVKPWNPGANNWVVTLAINGKTLYAGGMFTQIGGLTRNRIAAIDTATGIPTSWNPNASGQVGFSSGVLAIAVNNGMVYAGGDFTNIGGQARNFIAALDANTGNAITTWDQANNTVNAIAVKGGTIYLGGAFTQIGNQARSALGAIDANSGKVNNWNPDARLVFWGLDKSWGTSIVSALLVGDSTVYIGGDFNTVNGTYQGQYATSGIFRYGLAEVDASTGAATTWNPDLLGKVFALTKSAATLYVAGTFSKVGQSPRNHLASIDTDTGVATNWIPYIGNQIPYTNALALQGPTLFVGGGDDPALARFDVTLSSNADLSGIANDSGGKLTSVPGSSTGFTLDLPNAKTSFRLLVAFSDGNSSASISINGGTANALINNQIYGPLSLNVGSNTIKITVTAEDGTTQKTYSISANRADKPASTTSLQSSLNPSNYGQSVTFTATVSGSGTTPNGSVSFKSDGVAVTNCGTGGLVSLNAGSAVCAVSSLTAAGSPHIITADYSGDSAYAASSAALNGGQTVNKVGQIIIFGQAPTLAIGGVGNLVASGGGSGNPISFSSQTTGVCTVSGSTVTGKEAGTCSIAADQAGNDNYAAATQATQTFSIGKGSQVIAFGTAPTVVVGSSGTVSATGGASNYPVTFTSTTTGICTVSGSTVTGKVAGTCTIAADQAGNDNYAAATQATQTFTIGKGSQAISFGTAPTLVVGGSGTVTASGGASNDPVTFTSTTTGICTVIGNTVTGLAVGNCVIAANQAGNANYNAAPPVTQTISIAKANQTIAFGTSPSVIVGRTGTVSATGSSSGNPVTFTSTTTGICTVSGSTVTGVAAGACTIAANQEGNANYNPAAQVTQTFSVGKGSQIINFGTAPSVTVGDIGTVSATGGSSGNPVIFTSTTTSICKVSGNTVTGLAAGSCTIAANQSGNANYNAAPQATQQFNVTAGLALTVSNGKPSGGIVTSNEGGIVCGTTCNATFAAGGAVKLTATPSSGYQFSGWGGACTGYGNTCTVTMDASNTVTANFDVFKKKHRSAWRMLLGK